MVKFPRLLSLPEGLLPLATVAMEATWWFPVVAWISGLPAWDRPGPALSWEAVVLLLSASTFMTLVLSKQQWPIARMRVLAVASAFGVALLVLRSYYPTTGPLDIAWLGNFFSLSSISEGQAPKPLLGAVATLLIWARGQGIGREVLAFNDIYLRFLTGISLFFFLLATQGMLFTASPPVGAQDVLLFVFWALLGLALARLQEVAESDIARQSPGTTVARQWLRLLPPTVVGLLLLSVLLSSVMDLGPLLTGPLGALSGVAQKVFFFIIGVILIPIAYLAELLVHFGQWVLSLVGIRDLPDLLRAFDMSDLQEEAAKGEASPQMLAFGRIAAIVVVALGLGLALAFMLFRRTDKPPEDADEVRESVWSWPGMKAELLAWLRKLWERLRGRAVASDAQALHAFESREEAAEARSVRQLYRQLLALLRAQGLGRRASQTPYELLSNVDQRFPDAQGDFRLLTDAYVRARYGTEPPPPDELHGLSAALGRVRTMLQTATAPSPSRTRRAHQTSKPEN